MNKRNKTIAWLLAMAIAVTSIISAGPVQKVEAADAVAKTINMKQSDNSILGIDAPASTSGDARAWAGDYIYFGTHGGNPIKFRVLNPREANFGDTTILLDSDAILEQRPFGTDSVKDVQTNWTNAPLRTWCNGTNAGQFLSGFTAGEQNAIIASTKASKTGAGEFPSESYGYKAISGDKVFLLDASEANYSGYGYANDATRIKQGGIGEWWLRSTNPDVNDAVCTVYSDGNIYNYYFSNYAKVGVSPVINIDLDAVLLTSAYNVAKADAFNKVEANTTNEWRLTVKASDTSLAAITESETTFYVDQVETDERSVSITHVAANTALSTANQVSAMLTDAVGNVAYYGKINADVTATSSTVEISDELKAGNYNLYVFAEQVNDATATDYASVLGDAIPIVVESTQNATKYTVTVNQGSGSGQYETGAIVEIRADVAESGKQFAKWQVDAGGITLEDETNPITTFEMVAKDVKLTAVYEDITETSNTGDYTKLIWVSLTGLLIVLVSVLLVYKKKIQKNS